MAKLLTPEQEQERDKAFAAVVQSLRQGLLELARTYPQLAISHGRPLEISFGHELDQPGELHFGGERSNITTGKRPQEENIPDSQTWAFGVALWPTGQGNQVMVVGPLYPHLNLFGMTRAKAGEAKLDAALKKLLDEALAPLKALDEKVAKSQANSPVRSDSKSGAVTPANIPSGENPPAYN
jgi:hypothetical protein